MLALQRLTTAFSLFLLFILLAAFTATVRADDEKDADEYDETARVARVTFIRGDVQLKRDRNDTWESASINVPLVEGDTLATKGSDSRLEIQIDARNFVRLGGDSLLRIVSLRDEGVALSLSEGVATIRLARFEHDKEYFEIDAPGTTLAAEKRGLYRVDVSESASVRLTARDGGQARIYSETSGFTLRDGHTAELVSNGSEAGDWNLNYAEARDNWDIWVEERESYLASNLQYDGRDRYYDADVWGAEDLDAYGDWVNGGDYGWIWRPHITVINNYNNWAPYRYGHWVWCPPYGWTWVGDEPWGWAPYHYGRWVYYNDTWCWAPRGYSHQNHRNWWRPALVVFVYVPTSNGERVCWYPLTHGQHDPRSRNYRHLEPLRSNEIARLQRDNSARWRAITTLPACEFGRHTAHPERAPDEIARRAVTTEPVRGRLPITPNDGAGETDWRERRNARNNAARPPSATGLTQALPDRRTGAATRMPGVPLDTELRRTRFFNGREPRTASGTNESGAGGARGNSRNASENTGAVARPSARVRSAERPPVERGTQGNDTNNSSPWLERRAPRTNPREEGRPIETPQNSGQPSGQPARNNVPETTPERSLRPVSPRRNNDDNDQPASRPSRREARPEARPSAQPESSPEPRQERRREEREERRNEPRTESRPESRPEPRPESRPEPRQESRPESRPQPPPQSRPEPKQESRPEPKPETRQRNDEEDKQPKRIREP